MKYITLHQNTIPGGLGHSMYDYLSVLYISKAFDLKFLYTPIKIREIRRNMEIDKSVKNTIYQIFNFEKLNEYDNTDLSNYEKININFVEPYCSIPFDKLKLFFDKYTNKENIIFYLEKNNRIFTHEMIHHEKILNKNITKPIFNKIKNNLKLSNYLDNNITNIVCHIRRGDVSVQPLNYTSNILSHLLVFLERYNINCKIKIVSSGSNQQMEEIKKHFDKFKNTELILNDNFEKSFSMILYANIKIIYDCSFQRIASFLSDDKSIIFYHSLVYGKDTLDKNGQCKYFSIKDEEYYDNWIKIDDTKDLSNNSKIEKLMRTLIS